MPTAGPYGITQFDAPGVIGAYQQAQQNRIAMMLTQKQLERADKQAKDDEGIHKAVAAYLGGEKASESQPQPATAPSAVSPVSAGQSPASVIPAAYSADPLAPLPDAAPAPAATPAAAPAKPSGADREKLFNSLLAIDPGVATQYMDAFAKMDKAAIDRYAQTSSRIVQFASGLMQLPQDQRAAALQEAAPEAQQLGFTPEQLAHVDLSDNGLRQIVVSHMDTDKIAQFVKPDLMTVDHSVIDKNHLEKGAVFTAPKDFQHFSVHNADGTDTPYGFDATTGRAFQLRDDGTPETEGGGAPGGFEHAVEHVLSNEGGYNPSDMNGAPVNFGINQKANPGIDVKSMTLDQAKQIYHDKYWVPSGAESLPANLQAPYFDVYIRNPAFAKKALAQSGGDPAKFMQASSNYFQSLAKKPNGQRYAQAWANRDAKNTAIATGGGGGGTPISGKPLADNPDDDETAKFIGGQVALGQPMPPLGMGKQAAQMRKAILTEATRQWKAMGISPGEANVIAAENKSGLAELAKIAQMKATVQTAENTATANASQVLSLLGSAGSTGSPIFNAWQQAGRRATGNAKVSAFDVAVKTLATEYARVMSGGNSTQLSDAARHEADALIHTSMTPDQFRSAIKQMKIDMANRTKGIEQERQATLTQIRSGGRSKPVAEEGWQTLPSGLKVRRVQ